MQPILFPMPMIATSSTLPRAQYQAPVTRLASDSLSLLRRSSEVGNVSDAHNAQKFIFRTQYPIDSENQRPIPNAYAPNNQWSGPSPVTSGTLYLSAGTEYVNIIPEMSSSHPHLGSVTALIPVDTSGLQDHVLPGSASSGASHIKGHALPQQGTSSKVPDAQRIKRCTRNGKQPTQENQPTLNAYPRYMVPARSSHAHRDSVASLDSLLSRSSPGLQYDLVAASPFPGSVLDDPPAQIGGCDLPQQDTSSTDPESPQKRRRIGERKRNPNPKDPIAAERLQLQRLNDDVYIEMLYNLFVPKSMGQVRKKDRLRLSTSQSLCLSLDDG